MKAAYRLLALGTLAAFALFAWEARNDRVARYDEAQASSQAIAAVLSEHVDRTIQAADLATVAALESLDFLQERPRSPAEIRHVLQRIANAVPQLRLLIIIGADGNSIADSLPGDATMAFTDRSYFRHHRDDPSGAPYLSEPTLGRRSGRIAFNWSRRISHEDGSFAGVFVAVLEPEYFRSFFSRLTRRADESAQIYRSDGTLLATMPDAEKSPLDKPPRDLPAALKQKGEATIVDGEKIQFFQASAQFPIVIATERPVAPIESAWRGRTAFWAGGVLLAAASVALLLRNVDLRRRRWGESRFGAIAEASPTALIMTRADGHIEFANAQAERLFGYSGGEFATLQVETLLPEALRDAHARQRADYLQAPTARTMGKGRELLGRRKDGSEVPVEISLNPVTADGETMILASIVDLTDRIEAESRMRQAQRLEAVGQLTGGIAHDFNNLLAVVQGNLELLDEEITDADQRELIDDARRSVARGASLTRRLLSFARKQALMPEIVHLQSDIDRTSELLRRTLGEAIDITTIVAPGLWHVRIDPHQLDDALLNLAVNAQHAMPSGGALVIEAQNTELDELYCEDHDDVQPGHYVMLAVSDTGAGMSDEVVQRAFEPFFTTKGPEQGSGLGLSMVFGFVKQSGGHIKIYSELGIGTTIRLYLPAVLETPDSRPAVTDASTENAREGETVLIVEDDPDVRKVTVRIVESLGYTTVQAEDAIIAKELFENAPRIDVVLSDVVLPGGIDGPTFVRNLRAVHPHLPVIYISGYTANLLGRNGNIDADAAVLSKPVSRKELARALRAAIDGRRI